MALDIKEAYEENARSIWLGAILFVTLVGSIVLFTYIDITVHDYYALPLGSLCYTGNTNPNCIPIQKLHDCPTGGDACIEAKYYQMLQVEALALSGFLIFLKVGISQGLLRFEINKVRLYQTFVWGTLPLILLWSGWEDFLYYAVRGQPIPTTLPWLNNVGFMPIITQYITHDPVASTTDLFLVMFSGLLVVFVLWYFYAKFTKDEEYSIPI